MLKNTVVWMWLTVLRLAVLVVGWHLMSPRLTRKLNLLAWRLQMALR